MRTIVHRADGTYLTQHFDETGQPLSRVLSDGDPAGSPNHWATRVTRDSAGLVTEIAEPDSVTGYSHSSGSINVSTSAGRIRLFDRETSGDLEGLLKGRSHRNAGTGGDAYLDQSRTLSSTSLTVGAATLRRAFPTSSRVCFDPITTGTTGSVETTYSYAFHSGDAALRPQSITTTHAAVSAGRNGENTTHTTIAYLRRDGTPAFTKGVDGTHTYMQFSGGRLVKTIVDAQTNHGSDFAAGDDPGTDFGITETGDGLRLITTHSYDAQGRPDATQHSDGRVSKRYYSRLKDHRSAVLGYADFEPLSGTFHGPVSYTVTNHAGSMEASGTAAISGGSTTSASTGHIDESSADVKGALGLGTLVRLSTTVHDDTGRQAEESRVYFSIPTSLPGTEGTHYDATRYGYDDTGRRWRTKAPDGTINRTKFDAIGRHASTWIGLNDNDGQFPGGETTGTSDMVKMSEVEYDGGSAGGPGLVTKRILFVQDSATDKRETTYLHDRDHRVVVQVSPQAPHVLHRYDHQGRSVAMGLYSSSSGLSAATDPTAGSSANRIGLSETSHDERGRVWRTRRWEIDASTGNKGSSLDSLSWYDPAGRTIKVDGEQLAKMAYDRIGRQTRQYVLAVDDDSGYADADDVSGDIVLEEHVTAYDPAKGHAVLQATISRHHDDFGGSETTGALDTNADNDDLAITAGNLAGRAQIVAMWHDRFGRVTDTAVYGTNGGSTFNRGGLGVPARSDTVLVTSQVYNDDGSLKETVDPRGLVTRYEHDAAGRTITTIANYVNGEPSSLTADDDQILRFVYANGHRTKYWVDVYPADTDGTPDSEDQVTTYTYGVSKGPGVGMVAGDSKISSGSLLQKVAYPDSSGATDVVTYAYNAQGQEIWRKDQAGNILESDFDAGGRRTHHRVTTLAGGFDGAVRRISTTYDAAGRTSLITSHDHPSPGSGAVVNEVKHSYDGWGNLVSFKQDPDSAVGGSGFHEVTHAYEVATAGRNTLRRTTSSLPGSSTSGAVISYSHASTGGLHDGEASRTSAVRVAIGGGSPVTVAEYRYLGAGDVVGRDYPEPAVFWRQQGSSSGTYPDRDRFNRIVGSRWTKDLSTDIDFFSLEIEYDRSSNIVSTEDHVYPAGFDVKYAMDNLNRLIDADEGTLSSGSITSRTRRQQWTLDQVGNWPLVRLDLNGDGDWSDADELDETRSHNLANEILTREPDSSPPPEYTLTHDAAGNMTDDGETYTYEYDAWYRLRKLRNRSTSDLIAEHTYYGNGFRATQTYDTNLDGDVDGDDEVYVFAYDERWRIVATFRLGDDDPKERFVHHAAGNSGHGGSSYIDDVILRDRDADTAWEDESDGVLEERRYFCQNVGVVPSPSSLAGCLGAGPGDSCSALKEVEHAGRHSNRS